MKNLVRNFCIIIPARSGSKGIPNKNIQKINNQSLLNRAVSCASKLSEIEHICITTDSQEYIDHVKEEFNPNFLMRSSQLSDDNALAIDVWKDAIRYLSKEKKMYDYSLYLEPTSPLRNIEWIIKIIRDFEISNDELWMSVKETDSKYRIEKQFKLDNQSNLINFNNNVEKNSLRPTSETTYHKDGVFYIANNEYILETKSLLSGRVKGIINNYPSINIDSYQELEYAEYMLKKIN